LNAKLKANTIALKMHVRSREISSLLKSKGYNGFNEFTNRFRVEEVKSRLADPNMAHLKIEAIALDAGFGSKQSFYSAFEEYTGLNPSYYREEIFKN
jgi:transcriptional regulator GlxA family with amidase domain